jgi:hypothetical protein
VDVDAGGHTLRAVWGSSSTDVYAAGDGGTIIHYDGFEWATVLAGAADDLHALAGSGPGDVWAAGLSGTVLHYDETEWADVSSPDFRTDVLALLAASGMVHAAGSPALLVGPFVSFPVIEWPEDGAAFAFDKLAWSATGGGVDPTFNQVLLTDQNGNPFWTLVVDGPVTEVALPDIAASLGYTPAPDGPKHLNLTRGLNPDFDIDYYQNKDFSIWRRTSWAVGMSDFE